jgi:ketopantoate reductase
LRILPGVDVLETRWSAAQEVFADSELEIVGDEQTEGDAANTKQIVESESLTDLALDCMAEVQAAARTQGIELPRRLFEEVLSFSRSLGEFKPSMLQDLESSKPLVYQAFNGIVVKLLKAHGQPAPINQTFYRALKFLDQRIRGEAKL